MVDAIDPQAQSIQDQAAGYSQADVDAMKANVAPEMKYEGAIPAIGAAALGAANMMTFGGAGALAAKTGLVSPETQAGLAEHQPAMTALGGLGGLGLAHLYGVGEAEDAINVAKAGYEAAQAAGDVGEISKAKETYDTIKNSLSAGDLFNPLKAVGKVNSAISEGIGGYGGALAGGAVEGAAFGLGQTLNDYALGDPHINAEKIGSDLGIGAILGAGIGGLAHGAAGLLGKSGFIKGSITDGISSEASKADQEAKIINGTAETKGEMGDFSKSAVDAADRLGLPTPAGFASTNEWIQRGTDALINGAPTVAAIAKKDAFDTGYKGVLSILSDVAPEAALSKAETGEALQSGVTSKIEASYAPIKQTYEAIREVTPNLPLSERSAPAIARNILKMKEVTQTADSPQARLAQAVAKNILNAKTVEDIGFQKRALRGMANSAIPEERRIAAVLADKLNDWEESSIVRAGKRLKQGLEAADQEKQAIFAPVVARLDNLLPQIKEARAAYKPFIEDVSKLSEQLGKHRVYGPQDALNFIKDLDFEQLTNRLGRKDSSQFRSWFAEKFPQENVFLQQYQKGALRDAASKNAAGTFSPKIFFNKFNDMSPEMQKSLFSSQEISKIKDAQEYLSGFPKNFNPSGTERASAFREFFKSPSGAVIANARDFGIDYFIKTMGKLPEGVRSNPEELGQELAEKFNKMNAAKRITQRVTNNMIDGIKSIAGEAAMPTIIHGGVQSYNEKVDQISKLANHPEILNAQINNNTEGLDKHLPNITQSLSNNIVNSIQFLASKIPQEPPAMPLGQKWEPSNLDKDKFNEYYDAVNNPLSLLTKIKDGELSSHSMEAIQATHPNMLEEMRNRMVTELNPDKVKKMPLHIQEGLAMFMGAPLNSTMTQPVRAAYQATYANPVQSQANTMAQGQKKSSLGGLSKLKIASRAGTETNREEQPV